MTTLQSRPGPDGTMLPPPRRGATEPVWKSWLVLLSMGTDPLYLRFRLARAWARLIGRAGPNPPLPPAGPARDEAGSLGDPDVDLVYLWVSGQDPELAQERNEWLRRCGLPTEVFNPDVRYVENDELRYSLRSVDRFLPWVRRIFIVTNGQAPAWLERRNPRVRIVDHAEIFPDPSCLPTFNSVAIEAQLHNISGLAENFLYSNDDCFIGQPCPREDFFARPPDGRGGALMRVILSERWITPAHRVERDPFGRLLMYSYNSLKLALESRRPWWKVRYLDCHQVQPMVKSELAETTRRFARLYRDASGSRFRSADDVNFLVLTRYAALQRGRAVPGTLPWRFFRHEHELEGRGAGELPKLFCVNEGRGAGAGGGGRPLARLFPQPSSFERPALQPGPLKRSERGSGAGRRRTDRIQAGK
jgi:hypothetical protein